MIKRFADIHICTIYQALFPAALRLEGLRLLKYQDDPEVVEKIVV